MLQLNYGIIATSSKWKTDYQVDKIQQNTKQIIKKSFSKGAHAKRGRQIRDGTF